LSKEEKKDGNFPIFNDPDKRYSTFNLKYTHEIFDRLSGLVEFNTALNEQLIRDTIAECVVRRRALNQSDQITPPTYPDVEEEPDC